MTDNVKITISGVQAESDEGENTVAVAGRYRKVGDSHFIKYHDKSLEGAEADVLLRFDRDHFEISKSGDIGMHLVFEKGRTFTEPLVMPYGKLMVEVTTKKLDMVLEDSFMSAEIVYRLSIDGSYVSESKVTMQVRECSQ